MKKLPVGIQNFREIIKGGYVYADKTEYLHKMIKAGKYYFLSRPRRFGKSMLVDTMKELFEGNRDLFKGLWIDGSDYEWERHPVLRLDMTQADVSDTEKLRGSILQQLGRIAAEDGLSIDADSPVDMFSALIEGLRAKHGARVCVLVDEYDKPIIEHLDRPELADANREAIGNIYGVLKGQDANLAFVFVTGVSKFTKTSIFSKLNNLTDITMNRAYAGMCGFTEGEFDALFPEHITAYRKARKDLGGRDGGKELSEIRSGIFDWYDGYTWDGTMRVFNPFSLLSFFANNEYKAYWFATGIPRFLPGVFKDRPADYMQMQEAVINETLIDSHDIENAPLPSLLFQTGFLTINSVYEGPPAEYTLRFPNTEVSQSIAQLFLDSAADGIDPFGNAFVKTVREAFDKGEPERLEDALRGLYGSVPYQLHMPAEAYYQTIFLTTMQFLGFRVLGEIATAEGRMDGVVERSNGMTYVIEFKYEKAGADADESEAGDTAAEALLESSIEKAFRQIEDRSYADRYAGTRRKVFKVAIAVFGRGRVKVASRR